MKGEKMKNFDKFAKHLKDSISGVFLGAQVFHDKGYTVKINPSLLAPSAEEWESYADNGDLEISMRVEVKQSGYDFTSATDYPFKEMIVYGKNAWDRAMPKPKYIMHLNKAGTHYSLMDVMLREHWFVEELPDKRYGPNYTQEFYLCPVEKFAFHVI